MGNTKSGVMFHVGDRMPVGFDQLAQRVIRPAMEAIGMDWYGWHRFRHGIAPNLYELGAKKKFNASSVMRSRT